LDLLTHGLVGAALAQSAAAPREARLAAGVGFASGLLADADALMGSATDPLLVLEYHRHFTHALAFVPAGALIAAALLWPVLRRRMTFARVYLYAFLGYALAGLLDACTSYGTHLFWPFTEARTAWSIISVVDPIFTLLLAAALAIAIVKRRASAARAGIALAAAYLAIGLLQHERAEAAARVMAEERSHRPDRLLVKPAIGNVVLWRSLYVVEGRAHADAIRVGPLGGVDIYPGESIRLLDAARDLRDAPHGSRARSDTERFVTLAGGFAALHPRRPHFVGDVRYSMLPNGIDPLWGVIYDPGRPEAGVQFVADRSLTPEMRRRFIEMLLGR
jgi:inner membrane protein